MNCQFCNHPLHSGCGQCDEDRCLVAGCECQPITAEMEAEMEELETIYPTLDTLTSFIKTVR